MVLAGQTRILRIGAGIAVGAVAGLAYGSFGLASFDIALGEAEPAEQASVVINRDAKRRFIVRSVLMRPELRGVMLER